MPSSEQRSPWSCQVHPDAINDSGSAHASHKCSASPLGRHVLQNAWHIQEANETGIYNEAPVVALVIERIFGEVVAC